MAMKPKLEGPWPGDPVTSLISTRVRMIGFEHDASEPDERIAIPCLERECDAEASWAGALDVDEAVRTWRCDDHIGSLVSANAIDIEERLQYAVVAIAELWRQVAYVADRLDANGRAGATAYPDIYNSSAIQLHLWPRGVESPREDD